VRLLLFGDGELRAEMEAQARRLGITEQVVFAGAVPHDRLLADFAAGGVHIVVLASRDLGEGQHEGIPVSLMEAMAHGIPVVATSAGGVPELVTDVGVLVPPDDVAALATELRRLVDDPAERGRVGALGRKRVGENFDSARTSSELLECVDAASASASRGHDR